MTTQTKPTSDQKTQQNKIQQIIKSLDNDPDIMKVIKDIEESVKTTQNHYGRYMSFLSSFKTDVSFYIMSETLKRNGGNLQGIRSALSILRP